MSFSLQSLKEHLLFKGGTSLSKAYRLIHRFSEDIDISIQRESLGFGGEQDPANPKLSNKARTRQVDALADATKSQIFEKVSPELDQMIGNQGLNEDCTLTKDDTDPDQQSLAFAYPRTELTQDATAYVRPSVKIEFGARSDHWPAEIKEVQSYLAEAIPDAMHESRTEVKVMDVQAHLLGKSYDSPSVGPLAGQQTFSSTLLPALFRCCGVDHIKNRR